MACRRPPLGLPKNELLVGPSQQHYGVKWLLVVMTQQHRGSHILAWNHIYVCRISICLCLYVMRIVVVTIY